MEHRRHRRWLRTPLILLPAVLVLAGTEVRCAPATPAASDPTAEVHVSRIGSDVENRRPHGRSEARTLTAAAASVDPAALLVLLGIAAGAHWHLP